MPSSQAQGTKQVSFLGWPDCRGPWLRMLGVWVRAGVNREMIRATQHNVSLPQGLVMAVPTPPPGAFIFLFLVPHTLGPFPSPLLYLSLSERASYLNMSVY